MTDRSVLWRKMLRWAPLLLLCFGTVACIALLTTRGRPYAAHGLWASVLQFAGRGMRIGLVQGILFLLLFTVSLRVLRRLHPRLLLRVTVAGCLSLLPFFLYWARKWNHDHRIFANNFLEPASVELNLRMLGLFAVTAVLLFLFLYGLLRRHTAPRGRGYVIPLVLLVLLAGVLLPGRRIAELAATQDGTNVVFILIDALRADHLGCYGYDRDTSPTIDRIASESVVFTQAISQSTYTKTSVASFFTGKFPFEHGVYVGSLSDEEGRISSDVLGDRHLTLAEALLGGGLVTTAFVENAHLREFSGFGQGFLEYHDRAGGIAWLNRSLLPWMERIGRAQAFFAYVHYIDLHDPYLPRPPYDQMFGEPATIYDGMDLEYWGTYLQEIQRGERELSDEQVAQLRNMYDGQIRYLDDHLADFIETLKSTGLYDDTMIVITADHGDGFMEHGFISHSNTPYDELLRVPLIIKFPRGEHGGTRVANQVRLIDIYPTILEVAGVEVPEGLHSRSLLPLVEHRAPERTRGPLEQLAISEIAADIHDPDAEPITSIRGEGIKYIHFGDRPDELYDLVEDPGETVNLWDEESEDAQFYEELMQFIREQREQNAAESVPLSDETIKRLEALGYIGG